MNIEVTSNLFGKTDLTGPYKLTEPTTIGAFTQSLGIKWDHEALIVVNDFIVEENYELKEGDHIYLLTPIVGG
jgi:sulfur carrier protein ThiS